MRLQFVYFYDNNNNDLSSYYIHDNYIKLNGMPDTYKITSNDFNYEEFSNNIKNKIIIEEQ